MGDDIAANIPAAEYLRRWRYTNWRAYHHAPYEYRPVIAFAQTELTPTNCPVSSLPIPVQAQIVLLAAYGPSLTHPELVPRDRFGELVGPDQPVLLRSHGQYLLSCELFFSFPAAIGYIFRDLSLSGCRTSEIDNSGGSEGRFPIPPDAVWSLDDSLAKCDFFTSDITRSSLSLHPLDKNPSSPEVLVPSCLFYDIFLEKVITARH